MDPSSGQEDRTSKVPFLLCNLTLTQSPMGGLYSELQLYVYTSLENELESINLTSTK